MIISWDKAKLDSLIAAYAAAKEMAHSTFIWEYRESRFAPVTERAEFHIGYAKCLIEKLRQDFATVPDRQWPENRDGDE